MSTIVHSKTEKPISCLFSAKSEQIVHRIVYEPERIQHLSFWSGGGYCIWFAYCSLQEGMWLDM